METLACLMCGVTFALASWVALGTGSGGAAGARAALLARRARGWLAVLARTRPARALAGTGAWGAAAEALRRHPRARPWALSVDEASCALALAACVAGAVGGFASMSWVGALVGAGGAAAGVLAWSARASQTSRTEAAREVPGVFRSLAAALGSGRTLAQAVSYVGAEGTGPVSSEFRRASMAISCGVPVTEALGALELDGGVPGMGLMVAALEVSGRTGAPLHALFLRSARLVERQEEFGRSLMAKTAQVRLSARIVSTLPAVLVGGLSVLSPDFRSGLGTAAGMGCVALAVALDACALLVIRRLMRGVV